MNGGMPEWSYYIGVKGTQNTWDQVGHTFIRSEVGSWQVQEGNLGSWWWHFKWQPRQPTRIFFCLYNLKNILRTRKKKFHVKWLTGQSLSVTKFQDLSLLLYSRVYWLKRRSHLFKEGPVYTAAIIYSSYVFPAKYADFCKRDSLLRKKKYLDVAGAIGNRIWNTTSNRGMSLPLSLWATPQICPISVSDCIMTGSFSRTQTIIHSDITSSWQNHHLVSSHVDEKLWCY